LDLVTTKDDIEILEVESPLDLNAFIKLPFSIYKDDPNWVPPLISERKTFFDKRKNPFYRAAKTRLFLARKNGRLTGRIATCVNFNHNEFHQDKAGFFGFFDVFEDYDVAALLFKVAMITLKADGMERMIGPANFSTNQEVGMLVEGYDSPPVILMTYNKPYYNEFAERFGFKKAKDLLAYYIDADANIDPRLRRVGERVRDKDGIVLRSLRMKEFDAEVERLNTVYNQAWQKNWGFVPMSRDEFRHMAKDMKQIVDPDIVFIAEVNGKPVGFSLSLPNINQALIHTNGRLFPAGLIRLLWHTKIKNKVDSVRIITLGIIPEYQKRGLDTLLYLETFDVATRKGYWWGEMSWLLEDNIMMIKAAEYLGGRPYKTYRMYEMRV
jgi:ribosomal protein S18 acetylase RimI-like enzyme